jgi:hypothetical protein
MGEVVEVGPPKAALLIARILLPPARREDVLGDMEERFHDADRRRAAVDYVWDVVWTVPLVIVSQILKTADARLVCLEALGMYTSFVGASYLTLGARAVSFLHDGHGLLRLALPTLVIPLALLLADVYRVPGRRRAMRHVEQVCLALGVAFLSQMVCSEESSTPRWIMVSGSAMGLLLLPLIRMLFAAEDDKPASN